VPIYVTVKLKGGAEIKGDVPAENKDFAGKIEAVQYAYEVTHARPGVPGTRTFIDGTPVRTTGFRITKKPDGASPDLVQACASGSAVERIELVVTNVKDNKHDRIQQYVLTDAVIAAVTADVSVATDRPERTETLRISFAEMEVTHTRPDGTPVKQKVNLRQYS
jgi:type VI secretion system Hcp family effector